MLLSETELEYVEALRIGEEIERLNEAMGLPKNRRVYTRLQAISEKYNVTLGLKKYGN